MPLRLDSRDPGFEAAFKDFLGAKRETEADVVDAVAAILADVKARGDAAVLEYTAKFDRFELSLETMAIGRAELDAAKDQVPAETLSALDTAAARIRAFHEKQLPEDLDFTDAAGLRLGYRWQAVEAAGLYGPGGTAAATS